MKILTASECAKITKYSPLHGRVSNELALCAALGRQQAALSFDSVEDRTNVQVCLSALGFDILRYGHIADRLGDKKDVYLLDVSWEKEYERN